MENLKKTAPVSFLILGIIFIIIGFVQQSFTFSFTSGLFNLGVIFTLSGLVAIYLRRKS